MSNFDWSEAPDWATCVIVRVGYMLENNKHYHWLEEPRPRARMMKIETGTNFFMSHDDLQFWVIIERRPGALAMTDKAKTVAHDAFTPVKQPSTAPDLLAQAAKLLAERGQQYDKSGNERSAAKIVAAFNIITGRDLTPGEGWLFQILLKSVRFYSNTETPHRDSLEDMIAYTALHAEEYLNDK